MEIANHARVAAYVSNVGIPGADMPSSCACAVLDDGFDLPQTDPAPWYAETRTESAEFLGLYAASIVPQGTGSRSATPVSGRRSSLSRLKRKGRILQVAGLMQASTSEGMDYGERWLTEALRGGPCDDDGCPTVDLIILPACSEDGYDDGFRTLVNVGLLEDPVFKQVGELPECHVQEASFLLMSSMPYFYHPATRELDAVVLTYGEELAASLTTPDWMGEGTFVIDVTNVATTSTTDIVIQGQLSLDGSCPVTGDGTSVPPSFIYTIPELEPEDRIVIDGMRREVRLYDASTKTSTPDLTLIDWEGPFIWPDVGACATMCVTITGNGGDANVTVDSVLREA